MLIFSADALPSIPGSYITKEEMLDVVGSVYMLVGRHSGSIAEDAATKQHVDRIFQVGTDCAVL